MWVIDYRGLTVKEVETFCHAQSARLMRRWAFTRTPLCLALENAGAS